MDKNLKVTGVFSKAKTIWLENETFNLSIFSNSILKWNNIMSFERNTIYNF